MKEQNIVQRREYREESNIISCGNPFTSVSEINDDGDDEEEEEEEEEEEGNFSKARRK
jgi:hypothetical protein